MPAGAWSEAKCRTASTTSGRFSRVSPQTIFGSICSMTAVDGFLDANSIILSRLARPASSSASARVSARINARSRAACRRAKARAT